MAAPGDSRRKLYGGLRASGLLDFFKYFNFFADNLRAAAALAGINLSPVTLRVVLPVGISFYTFQTLSYVIDVCRRQMIPTRSVSEYMAYVTFFPQLVAGPIERAGRLLPQFQSLRRFDLDEAREGLRFMLWGFVKKMALADNLGAVATRGEASTPRAITTRTGPRGGPRACATLPAWRIGHLIALSRG